MSQLAPRICNPLNQLHPFSKPQPVNSSRVREVVEWTQGTKGTAVPHADIGTDCRVNFAGPESSHALMFGRVVRNASFLNALYTDHHDRHG